MNKLIGMGVTFGLGVAIGYVLFGQQPAPARVPAPAPAVAPQRWVPRYPAAGYAESVFTNINKYGTPAVSTASYSTNGSVVYVD